MTRDPVSDRFEHRDRDRSPSLAGIPADLGSLCQDGVAPHRIALVAEQLTNRRLEVPRPHLDLRNRHVPQVLEPVRVAA